MDTFNWHTMINNPAESTTIDGTTVDALFSRYLEKITSQSMYVTYFSNHR